MKDHLRVIEFCIVLLTASFGAFFYLDALHADRTEFRKAELELRKQMIQNELNRDHFARRRYEQLIQNGEAGSSDFVRYDYLMLDIQNKQAEKELVNQQLSDLE